MSTLVLIMKTLPSALFGKTRRNVLGVLFSRPDEQMYVRELARMAGVAPGATQRELARLTEAGILLRSVRGNQVYYRANPKCPIFAELVGLVTKTVGLADALRTALTPVFDQIRFAFIYGSAARGELRRGSDADLFIVGNITLAQLVLLFQPVQQKIAREINPVVYSLSEFESKIVEGHHFVSSVVRENKIFLVGDEREFAALAEQRLGERAPHEPTGNSRSVGGGRS